MDKRLTVIACAIAAAAILLWVTLLAESPPSKKPPSTIDDPITTDHLLGFDPYRTSTGQIDPRGQAKQYRINRVNKRGQLIEMFGDQLSPLPNGVADVTFPGARVHLSPDRVLEILGKQGTIVAPDNQPQSGQFIGPVVVSLYQNPLGQPVQLEDQSKDTQLRMFLNDAAFDLDLGTIDSNKQVHLTGPRFDFRGVGLSLTYNALHKRIDRLRVLRGRTLRFHPNNDATPRTGTPFQTPKSHIPPDQTAPTSNPNSPAPDTDDLWQPEQDRPAYPDTVQWYRATFQNRVRIRSPEMDVEADRLEIIFSMGSSDELDNRLSQISQPASTLSPIQVEDVLNVQDTGTVDPRYGFVPSLVGLVFAQIPDPASVTDGLRLPADRTMAPVRANDVIVTWHGQLTVEPQACAPVEIADADDLKMTLVGRPVRITTTRQDILTASTVEYLASSGRVALMGTPEQPLTIDSPQMGLLQGQQLVIDQGQAVGQMLGPGSLRSNTQPGLIDAVSVDRSEDFWGSGGGGSGDDEGPGGGGSGGGRSAVLPSGMAMTWQDRMDLTFAPHRQGNGSPRRLHQIRSLTQATFHGQVQVEHPEFKLASDQLTIGMDKTQTRGQKLDTIQATGEVWIEAQLRTDPDPVEVRCDRLSLDMTTTHDNQQRPASLSAQGTVVALQGEHQLWAQQLDISFQPDQPPDPTTASLFENTPSPTELTDAPPPVSQHQTQRSWAIQQLVATDQVRIKLHNRQVSIQGDRVTAEPGFGQVEVFGHAQATARVQGPQGYLTGQHIVMNQSSETLHVLGPGYFQYNQLDQERKPQEAATAVSVTWNQAMHFDNRFGLAQFLGQVVSNAQRGSDTSKLTTHDLRLEFTQIPQAQRTPTLFGDTPPTTTGTAENQMDRLSYSNRVIRLVTARGDVNLVAQSWADTPGKQLDSRLRLTGPLVSFDNVAEQIQVIGPGTFLLEDYRPKPDRQADRVAIGAQADPVSFVGQGATLFKWTGQMLLDTVHNQATIDDNVQVIHRDFESSRAVQLDCQHILADLQPAGDAVGKAGFSSQMPKLNIQAVYADQDVRVISGGRTFYTDQLRYTGYDQQIVLQADKGNVTQMLQEGQTNTVTAQSLRWNLTTDQIEVINPGSGLMPIR